MENVANAGAIVQPRAPVCLAFATVLFAGLILMAVLSAGYLSFSGSGSTEGAEDLRASTLRHVFVYMTVMGVLYVAGIATLVGSFVRREKYRGARLGLLAAYVAAPFALGVIAFVTG